MSAVIVIAPNVRDAESYAHTLPCANRLIPIRVMSARQAAGPGLYGYGEGDEIHLVNPHFIPAAAWDQIQTVRARGATVIENGEQ